jgi:hypothetical protein
VIAAVLAESAESSLFPPDLAFSLLVEFERKLLVSGGDGVCGGVGQLRDAHQALLDIGGESMSIRANRRRRAFRHHTLPCYYFINREALCLRLIAA